MVSTVRQAMTLKYTRFQRIAEEQNFRIKAKRLFCWLSFLRVLCFKWHDCRYQHRNFAIYSSCSSCSCVRWYRPPSRQSKPARSGSWWRRGWWSTFAAWLCLYKGPERYGWGSDQNQFDMAGERVSPYQMASWLNRNSNAKREQCLCEFVTSPMESRCLRWLIGLFCR